MNSHAASPTGEGGHIPTELLGRYTSGDTGSGPSGAWWVVEAHLENCARCRDRLRDAVGHCSPATEALLDRVRDDLAAEVDRSPRCGRDRICGTACHAGCGGPRRPCCSASA